MIKIRITNATDVVEKQKGWFVAHVVGSVVDMEKAVEETVIAKLRESFAEQGIEANFEHKGDPNNDD